MTAPTSSADAASGVGEPEDQMRGPLEVLLDTVTAAVRGEAG